MNPSNLAFGSMRIVLIDWDLAGPNDPFYDLATVRCSCAWTTAALIAEYDGARALGQALARTIL